MLNLFRSEVTSTYSVNKTSPQPGWTVFTTLKIFQEHTEITTTTIKHSDSDAGNDHLHIEQYLCCHV